MLNKKIIASVLATLSAFSVLTSMGVNAEELNQGFENKDASLKISQSARYSSGISNPDGGAIMNILEELYFGNIAPNEKCARLNSEVTKLLKLLNRNEVKLTVTFSEGQKITFEKYKDCNREISEICERQSFITGFNLGAKIVIESMT